MKPELQKRLVLFSTKTINLVKYLKLNVAAKLLYEQLVRSATSAALNYGEAQTAESRKDFIHKLGIVLKELKETEVNLEIINESGICTEIQFLDEILNECKQLIAIFMATRKTARENDKNKNQV